MTDSNPETPDTSNPFDNSFATSFASEKQQEAEEELTALRAKNTKKGKEIMHELRQIFAPSLNDSGDSDEQMEAAEQLSVELDKILDFFGNGLAAGNTAPDLSLLQQEAVVDVGNRRLFKHPSGAWGDTEWSRLRDEHQARTSRPVPQPPVVPVTPAPPVVTPEPSSEEAAPSSDDAGSSEPTTPAVIPTSPAPAEDETTTSLRESVDRNAGNPDVTETTQPTPPRRRWMPGLGDFKLGEAPRTPRGQRT